MAEDTTKASTGAVKTSPAPNPTTSAPAAPAAPTLTPTKSSEPEVKVAAPAAPAVKPSERTEEAAAEKDFEDAENAALVEDELDRLNAQREREIAEARSLRETQEQVKVKLVRGKFRKLVNGERKIFLPGDKLTISRSQFKSFRDQFEEA